MNRPAYSRGSSWGEELGGLQEGVGSEDGGDNLAGGVDSAFAVRAGLGIAAPRVGAQAGEDADADRRRGAVDGRAAQGRASERRAGRGFCRGGEACYCIAFPRPAGQLPGARRCAAGFTLEASKPPCAGHITLILTLEHVPRLQLEN